MVPHALYKRPLDININQIFGRTKGGNYMISEFKLGRNLGGGTFGEVYIAELKSDKTRVALKKIKKSGMSHAKRYVLEEIKNQAKIGSHPFILPLLDYFWTRHTVYLILPVAQNGALSDKWLPNGEDQPAVKFSHREAGKYTYQIASALDYCHRLDVVHRDIKMENILLVGDFGCSGLTNNRRNSRVGTLEYRAPEMITGTDHGKEVDNWAIGVLLYEMLTAHSPFGDYDHERIVEHRIMMMEYRIPADVDAAPSRIIKRLLKERPQERMKLCNLMKHPWIKANK